MFFTVDGLVLCNQHIFRSSKEANINISQTSTDMLSNVSRGSDHASFPFVEDIPFIATIWAGLEGFHMTVNGRHETSFAYREVRYELLIITHNLLWELLYDITPIC